MSSGLHNDIGKSICISLYNQIFHVIRCNINHKELGHIVFRNKILEHAELLRNQKDLMKKQIGYIHDLYKEINTTPIPRKELISLYLLSVFGQKEVKKISERELLKIFTELLYWSIVTTCKILDEKETNLFYNIDIDADTRECILELMSKVMKEKLRSIYYQRRYPGIDSVPKSQYNVLAGEYKALNQKFQTLQKKYMNVKKKYDRIMAVNSEEES